MDTSQQAKTWISRTPDVCGGEACIRDSRIPVWSVIAHQLNGATDEFLLDNYDVTPEDLAAAWEYYRQHPQEIDEAIARQEQEPED